MMYGVSERELLSRIKEDTQAKFRVWIFTNTVYTLILLTYLFILFMSLYASLSLTILT